MTLLSQCSIRSRLCIAHPFLLRLTMSALLVVGVAACAASEKASPAEEEVPQEPWDGSNITIDDFTCITDGTKVGNYYVLNKAGKLDEAVAVAQSPTGGVFPEGTFLSLIPWEVMVKRIEGFSPETSDWEFFALDTAQNYTQIYSRGTLDVLNQFDGNCFDCHKEAEPQWDLICGKDHGCDEIDASFTQEQLEIVQNTDPRCQQ